MLEITYGEIVSEAQHRRAAHSNLLLILYTLEADVFIHNRMSANISIRTSHTATQADASEPTTLNHEATSDRLLVTLATAESFQTMR